MSGKKLTDNGIIKALECCSNYSDCDKCNFEPKDNKKKTVGCCLEIMKNALDLITRQQTEIERLRKEVNLVSIQFQDLQERYEEAQTEINRLNKENENLLCKLCEKVHRESKVIEKLIKTEAYKEFVEKLKEFMHNKFKSLDEYEFEYITERDINNLLKETVGEGNA